MKGNTVKHSRLVYSGLAVAVAAIAVVAITASGGGSSTSSASHRATTTAPATAAPAPTAPAVTMPAPAPAPAPASAMVRVAHDATHGDLLVAGNGHTVYYFAKDQGTVSACTGACAGTWPAWMTGGAPIAGPGVDASMLGSAHGQVTYAGHLLYFFSGDLSAGTSNGV